MPSILVRIDHGHIEEIVVPTSQQPTTPFKLKRNHLSDNDTDLQCLETIDMKCRETPGLCYRSTKLLIIGRQDASGAATGRI